MSKIAHLIPSLLLSHFHHENQKRCLLLQAMSLVDEKLAQVLSLLPDGSIDAIVAIITQNPHLSASELSQILTRQENPPQPVATTTGAGRFDPFDPDTWHLNKTHTTSEPAISSIPMPPQRKKKQSSSIRDIRAIARRRHLQQTGGRRKSRMMTIADLDQRQKQRDNVTNDPVLPSAHSLADLGTPERLGVEAWKLTNEFRKSQGLAAVAWDGRIAKIGEKHSQDMASGRVAFGHGGFNARAREIGGAAGENVAWNSYGPGQTAAAAVKGWEESPGHRKNMLGANWTVSGIGVCTQGGRTYFCQLFSS